MEGLRAEVEELRKRLDVADQVASTPSHRERHLRLVHALGRELIRVHAEWADAVQRELAPPSRG
jgi:hypothetical protein